MDTLKKLFPLSWKYSKGASDLIIGILIYLVVGIVAGVLIRFAGAITGWIPVIDKLAAILLKGIGGLIDLYVIAGIVIQILVFTKVLKK